MRWDTTSQPRCAFGGCGALARSPQAPLHQIRAQPGLVRPGLTRLASTAHRWRLWIQSCRAAVEIGFQCRRGVRKDQFGMEGRACHQTGHGPHRHPDHHAHRPQRARDHTARTTAMVLQGLKRAQKSAGDKMDQVAASTGRSLSPVTRKSAPEARSVGQGREDAGQFVQHELRSHQAERPRTPGADQAPWRAARKSQSRHQDVRVQHRLHGAGLSAEWRSGLRWAWRWGFTSMRSYSAARAALPSP